MWTMLLAHCVLLPHRFQRQKMTSGIVAILLGLKTRRGGVLSPRPVLRFRPQGFDAFGAGPGAPIP